MLALLTEIGIVSKYDSLAFVGGLDAQTAATQRATVAAEAQAAAEERLQTTTTDTARRLTTSTTAIERLQRSLDSSYASAQRFAQGEATIQAALDRGVISAERGAELLDLLRQKYAAIPAAAGAVTAAVEQQTRSFGLSRLGILELQAAGINAFQALAAGIKPATVVMTEGAQVFGAFAQGGLGLAGTLRALASPIGLAVTGFTALAGATALVVAHAASDAEALRQYDLTIRGLGAGAATTAAQLQQVARSLRDAGISDAGAQIQNVIRAGINPALAEQVVQAGADVGALLGIDAAAGTQRLTTALNSGIEAMVKLDLQVRAITATEAENLLEMGRMGEGADALRIALDALQQHLAGSFHDSLTGTQKVMLAVGDAWRDTITAIADSAPIQAAIGALGQLADAIDRVARGLPSAANAANAFTGAGSGALTGAVAGTVLGGPIGGALGALGGAVAGAGLGYGIGPYVVQQPGAYAAIPPAGRVQLSPDDLMQIVAAVIRVESGGNPNAVSPAGAMGLMQLMPGTAAQYGINPYNPSQNVAAGTQYLTSLVRQFGSPRAGLEAYNYGPGNMMRAGGNVPASVAAYANQVLGLAGYSGNETLGAGAINAAAVEKADLALKELQKTEQQQVDLAGLVGCRGGCLSGEARSADCGIKEQLH